jgi:small subunit ribosomal protein S2
LPVEFAFCYLDILGSDVGEEIGMEVSMKQLLEAGVHFGHQTSRWNPKMKRYIFGARNGIYIIDLQQTVKLFESAYAFVRELAAKGGHILMVGTKKQAQDAIREEADRCGMFYVNTRWLGGTLTNFQTIKQSIDRLKKLEETLESPVMAEALTKKELLNISRERDKLLSALGGIKNMRKLPDALFVIDPQKEEIAVKEANKLHIPVVAVVDTNCDPDLIDHKIPGNDDAIRAIRLFCAAVADAVVEGRAVSEERSKAEADETPAEESAPAAEPAPEGSMVQ